MINTATHQGLLLPILHKLFPGEGILTREKAKLEEDDIGDILKLIARYLGEFKERLKYQEPCDWKVFGVGSVDTKTSFMF